MSHRVDGEPEWREAQPGATFDKADAGANPVEPLYDWTEETVKGIAEKQGGCVNPGGCAAPVVQLRHVLARTTSPTPFTTAVPRIARTRLS